MVSARAALVLFSCVVLYSVQYASAMKCYTCMSDSVNSQDCFIAPKNSKYLLDCSAPQDDMRYNTLANKTEMINIMKRIFKADSLGDEHECVTVEGKMKQTNSSVVLRGCLAKNVKCDAVAETLRHDVVFQSDACKKCTAEGCNSSDAMKAGIWSLIVSLAMLSYFKF